MKEGRPSNLSDVIIPAERADMPKPFSHTGTEMAAALAEEISVFIPDGRTWQVRHFGHDGVQVVADRKNGWRTYKENIK